MSTGCSESLRSHNLQLAQNQNFRQAKYMYLDSIFSKEYQKAFKPNKIDLKKHKRKRRGYVNVDAMKLGWKNLPVNILVNLPFFIGRFFYHFYNEIILIDGLKR